MQLGSPIGLYGAERWILALLKHLDKSKIESLVSTIIDAPGLEAPVCKEAEKFGFSSHLFESHGRFNLSAVKALRTFIIEHDIDIIHTHGYKTDITGLLAAKGTNCKIVSTPHGWTKQPDIKLRLYEIIDRMIFPFMDAVVPLSDDLFHQLSFIPGVKKRLNFIRNGVDITEIDSVSNVAQEVSVLKKDGLFIIGYIGRIIPGKALDVLMHAVARYGQEDWRVVIVGEGEQQDELQSLVKTLHIEDTVAFLGYREDRLELLIGFDTFVLPSRSEGIPRCVMEAMAAGIPVIASDIPGCRYLVEHNNTGLLFQPDNPEQLADSLKSLYADPSLRVNLSQRARDFVSSGFSASRMAKEYEDLFFQLAG